VLEILVAIIIVNRILTDERVNAGRRDCDAIGDAMKGCRGY